MSDRGAIVRIIFLTVALAVPSTGQASQRTSTAAPQSGSPAQGLSLAVTEDSGAIHLALRHDTRVVGSIAVPAGLTRAAVEAGVAEALWHPNGKDVAVGVSDGAGSFVVVFLEQPDGEYLAVDVSRVERTNIGGVGPSRTYPVRRTRPIEWMANRQLEGAYAGRAAVQIELRTELRDETGRRYAMAERLIITRDGTPLWR